MSRNHSISLIEWGLIASIFLADLALAHITGISMSITSPLAESLVIIFMFWPFTILLTRLTRLPKNSGVIVESIIKYLSITIVGSALEYYIATNQAPLNDTSMVKMDQLLGFSWPVFFDWANHHEFINTILGYFYASLHLQVAFLILVVGAIYPDRARRFVTVCFIAVLLTLLIFGLFPAAGPFVYFGHTDLPQAFYTEHYLRMRDHTLARIPLDDLRGIVSFPSLHVAGAIILTYFFRGLPLLFVTAVILNIGMGIASLVIGGHYLVDLLGGIAVGIAALATLPWLDKDRLKNC